LPLSGSAFLFGRAARIGNDGLIILATEYEPIADDDYVDDPSVGAMMDATAIRKALERALNGGAGDLSVFHVHRHEHDGAPWFSSIDLCESAKFAPSFFHVAPKIPHGVIVLSHDQAAGLWWTSEDADPQRIDRIVSVGAPLRYWDASR
jgi:hypothetical protein